MKDAFTMNLTTLTGAKQLVIYHNRRIYHPKVVGSTSLQGGIGNMIGGFISALIMIIIENAITFARLPYTWTFMAFGLIILFSVLLDLFIEKRI